MNERLRSLWLAGWRVSPWRHCAGSFGISLKTGYKILDRYTDCLRKRLQRFALLNVGLNNLNTSY